MKQICIDYVPTSKQRIFHEAVAHEKLYGGAAGGGKSCAMVNDALMWCMRVEGFQAYMFRKTFPELEKTLINEAHKSIPYGLGRYNKSSHVWSFGNGSAIHFCHCQNAGDRFKYQGAEIHKLYIDELTQWEFSVFSYLKTRLRTDKKLGVRPMAAYGTNPGGIGNAWVKGRFIDVAPPLTLYTETVYSELLQEEMKATRLFIPALVTDNPNVGKEYVFELEQKPAALRDALLYGKWNTFEGQVFWEFTDDPDNYRTGKNTHVIEPFEIPAHWTRYRSLDWGYSKPFSVGWWACDEDGVLYRYREWYGCKKNQPDTGLQMTPQEVARQIAECEKGEGQIIGVADPAIWRSETGECIANMMSKEGVYFNKADNSRLAGKIQLHNRFRFRENQEPMAYIFNTCRDFIRTIPSLVYDERKIEDVDTDGEDHIYDETRYMFMQRPIKAQPIKTLEYNYRRI